MLRKIVKMNFKSSLHMGSDNPGINDESAEVFAHSDTIFSCIANSLREVLGSNKIDEFLHAIMENPNGFKVSSAFPYKKASRDKVDFYLPKPLTDLPDFWDQRFSTQRRSTYGKDIRKIRFINQNLYLRWIKGESVLFDIVKEDKFLKSLFVELRPRNAIDRVSGAANIFHTALLHFPKDAGLYFIVQFDESIIDEKSFETVLENAGINGLGGERCYGCGIFKPSISEVEESKEISELFAMIDQGGDDSYYTTLSLVHPGECSDFFKPVTYNLIPRRGWIYSTSTYRQMKRKECFFLSEGSAFGAKPNGGILDMTPEGFTDHNVYRLGTGLFFPLKLPESIKGEVM